MVLFMTGEYIDIGVGALIVDGNGRLLLVRHKLERGGYWQGKWILPGGMLKPGETMDEGIVREVMEETGLNVILESSDIEPVERIVADDGLVNLHVVYIVKRARLISGVLKPASDVGEAMWVFKEDIEEIRDELHPDTVRILENFGVIDN